MSIATINNFVGHDNMSSLEVYELLKNNISRCRENLLENFEKVKGKYLERVKGKCVDLHVKSDIKKLQEEKQIVSDALVRFDKFEKHLKKIEEYENEIMKIDDEEEIYKKGEDIKKEQILLKIMFCEGSDDVLPLENGYRKIKKDGRVGVAEPDGTVIIQAKYDDVLPLKNGYRKIKKDGKVGVAAPDGTVIIPAEYDDVLPLENGYRKVEKDDKDGLADSDALPLDNLYRKLVKDGKAGVADSDGIVIIPVEYDKESFSKMRNGNLPYLENKLRGIMSKDGVVLHKAEYNRCPELLDNGYAVVENYSEKTRNTKGLLNDKGNLVIPLGFSRINLDSYGLVSVSYCVNDKESLQGRLEFDLKYGLVKVYEGIKEKHGKYTLDGDEVIPCDYDSMSEKTGSEGIYKARRGSGECLIKNDGTVIFDSNEYFKPKKNFWYETYDIGSFVESRKGEPKVAKILMSRRINESYGNYGRYANASYGLINRKYGLIDENGKVLIYPKYATELQHYDGDLYLTTKEVGTLLGKLLGKNKTMNIYVSCEDGKEYVDNKKLI